MNKHSMVFFGSAALVAGVALTPHREWVRGRARSGSAARCAAVVFAPNLWWEYRHDWATLELLRNVQATGKNVELSPLRVRRPAVALMELLPAFGPRVARGAVVAARTTGRGSGTARGSGSPTSPRWRRS